MSWTNISVKDRAGVYLEYYESTDELTITDSGGTIDIIDCVKEYSFDELVSAVYHSFKDNDVEVEKEVVYHAVENVMR